jgi:hypothetical protein
MPSAQKILGQVKPSGATDTDLYTVPASTDTILSCLFACNQSGTQDTIRVWLAPAGAATSSEQYLYYDFPVPGNQTFLLTTGPGLATTDVIRVRSANGDISFTASGREDT